MEKPVSAYDIQHWLAAQGEGINQVTVYRVLSALEKSALVHRHPCDRSYSLCTIPEVKGHHGFLHCSTCGRTQEFSNDGLSEAVRKVARSQKFQPLQHMSELVGTCVLCAS
jgi:Fur family ferric uptake transcriptional regulator